MSYSNGRITAPVNPIDVQRAIGVDSKDVKTLCISANINLWARYRPIPCERYENNQPKCLTPEQRLSERYGIDPPVDMFTADDEQAFTNYANDLDKYGQYYIKLRPWGDTKWARLSDFAKTDANGVPVANVGYNHNAAPDNVIVTIRGGYGDGTHSLQPIVPENSRDINISPNATARYYLPNDHLWVSEYYKYVAGLTPSYPITVQQNEEFLSPMDFMASNTYSGNLSEVRRGVLTYRWADSQQRIEGDPYYDPTDAEWRFYKGVKDTVGGNSQIREYNETNKGAWIDLNAVNVNEFPTSSNHLNNLKGRCLFIEFWQQSNSFVNKFPILGLAYEVNITRSASVDISGMVTFVRTVIGMGDFVLEIEADTASLNGADTLSRLREWLRTAYSALSLSVGNVTVNLLEGTVYGLSFTPNGNTTFIRMEWMQTFSQIPTTSTISAVVINAGAATKDIPVCDMTRLVFERLEVYDYEEDADDLALFVFYPSSSAPSEGIENWIYDNYSLISITIGNITVPVIPSSETIEINDEGTGGGVRNYSLTGMTCNSGNYPSVATVQFTYTDSPTTVNEVTIPILIQ